MQRPPRVSGGRPKLTEPPRTRCPRGGWVSSDVLSWPRRGTRTIRGKAAPAARQGGLPLLRGDSTLSTLVPRHVERVGEGDELRGHDPGLAARQVKVNPLAVARTAGLVSRLQRGAAADLRRLRPHFNSRNAARFRHPAHCGESRRSVAPAAQSVAENVLVAPVLGILHQTSVVMYNGHAGRIGTRDRGACADPTTLGAVCGRGGPAYGGVAGSPRHLRRSTSPH